MLSSTAKNLYWMGRYLQRAKSTARLIEATQRMALQSRGEEAAGVAAIFGMEDEFRQSQAQGDRLASLIDFLVLDENNPSSIVNSIGAARRNAREERNNITVDVWESLNALWLELSARLRGNRATLDRGALIESVKKQAVMIFGAAQVTLLRDEANNFLQLGAFLERADNTGRILDVKFHLLRPDGNPSAEGLDYFAWSELLACIGAVRTYRRIYRSSLNPMKVAELMMLRRDVPRSVHHCLWMVDLNMRELADTYGTHGEADRLAGELHARLRYARIDRIFDVGLAKFLGGLRGDIGTLSDEIGRQFLLD
ncbi:MAG: alpha-E domain-containing protein [Reyranella sp.]|uniref:alpha-E domain-containing protein n=1 Tax=Reyranella sp. TaxID=1929291 RepID=UPI00122404CE|nr:alpha-E domain-containing protein [Reyranella sp.]TAJ90323.1 MAG: alpha-E domain-containing protein [Reyranella sp.]TBR28626.1 MAG: alpha-E domain-containing protein [Reyranella sp.]